MENQSAQQSEPQNNEAQSNAPQDAVQQPVPITQQPVESNQTPNVAPVEEAKNEAPIPVEATTAPAPNSQEVKEEKKVEGSVEPVSQQVSNPVDTTKEGISPVNSKSNTPVNSQGAIESNPQSISQSNLQPSSQSNPQVNSQSNPQSNSQNNPVSSQIDKVDNAVSEQTSSDRLAANSYPVQSYPGPYSEDQDAGHSSQNNSSAYPLKLFVGGLYYQTEEDVSNFFKQYGKILD